MKLFFLFASAILTAAAQTPSAAVDNAKDADTAKNRAAVIRLLDVDGTRSNLREGLLRQLPEAKAKMREACPKCSPELAEEWGRRMVTRFNLDDVIEIYVSAYLEHLKPEEIRQMTELIEARNKDPKSVVVPEELQKRVASVLPSLSSEIMGGSVQYFSKLGAEIGMEVEKEHPEYTKGAYEKDK